MDELLKLDYIGTRAPFHRLAGRGALRFPCHNYASRHNAASAPYFYPYGDWYPTSAVGLPYLCDFLALLLPADQTNQLFCTSLVAIRIVTFIRSSGPMNRVLWTNLRNSLQMLLQSPSCLSDAREGVPKRLGGTTHTQAAARRARLN